MTITTSTQDKPIQDLIKWNPDALGLNQDYRILFNNLGIKGTYSFTGASGQGATIRYSLDTDNTIFHTGQWNNYIDNATVRQIPSLIPSDQQTAVIKAMRVWGNYGNLNFVQDDNNPNLVITEASSFYLSTDVNPDTFQPAYLLRIDPEANPNTTSLGSNRAGGLTFAFTEAASLSTPIIRFSLEYPPFAASP